MKCCECGKEVDWITDKELVKCGLNENSNVCCSKCSKKYEGI